MPVSQIDFLIIGQGLAGSILAFELIARGQRVLVIDNNYHGSASHVAAGIINPITGHRLNLTEGFIDYFTRATKLYEDIECETGSRVISRIDQIRLIKNPGQASYFEKRLQQNNYDEFLDTNSSDTLFKKCEYGTAKIKQTSVVDTKLLLRKLRTWLTSKDAYVDSKFDYSQLHILENKIKHQSVSADKIIFCEGYQAINNPWLKNLPFKLAKGEVLTIEQQADTDIMLSWGNWLVNIKNGATKLGASYAWHDTDLSPSADIQATLLNSLEDQTGSRPKVLNHEVGIRPTTTDRNAFVGAISALRNAYCFNGFGSKGCLTIPAHADLLCDHLIDDKALPEGLTKWL